MKEIDMIKDVLYYRISNQIFYNENIINIRNPEARQLFTQIRDDEMRSVSKLQQKIERWESPPSVVAKMFPTREHY
jgi:rubrerythrin